MKKILFHVVLPDHIDEMSEMAEKLEKKGYECAFSMEFREYLPHMCWKKCLVVNYQTYDWDILVKPQKGFGPKGDFLLWQEVKDGVASIE